MAEHAASTDRELDDVDEPQASSTDTGESEAAADQQTSASDGRDRRWLRRAAVAGLAMVAALAGLAAWMTTQAYHAYETEQERALFLSVGRQGAMNLTTIDFKEADAAIQRILDSSTGAFHDDFEKRVEPFVGVVKETQSVTEGTITEAALESVEGNQASVLVAVSVKTTAAGAPAELQPRLWRMRINVERTGDHDAKISEVVFVQ